MNNRHDDKKGRYELQNVTIETVDQAVFDYFDKKLNAQVDTPSGRKKVPVIMATGERWKILRNKGLRDENKTLILPLITIQRIDIDRTPGFGGLAQEDRSITISSKPNSKTNLFENLLSQRVSNGFPVANSQKKQQVVDYLTIPYPDFCTIFYQVVVWTQYMTQMNEVLEKIFYMYDWRDSFAIPRHYDEKSEPQGQGYFFVGFREGNVSSQTNLEEFTDQERIIKYTYNFKVPAFLVLDPKDRTLAYGKDEEGKFVVEKQQNVVSVSLKESILTVEEFQKMLDSKK